MFLFLLISLVVVVAAVTLAVVGSGDQNGRGASGGLAEAPPDMLDEPLPPDRPVGHADVAGLRLAVGVRGYRMRQVDDILDRLGAELAERDARIAELESALAGAQAVAMGRAGAATPTPPEATPGTEAVPHDRTPEETGSEDQEGTGR